MRNRAARGAIGRPAASVAVMYEPVTVPLRPRTGRTVAIVVAGVLAVCCAGGVALATLGLARGAQPAAAGRDGALRDGMFEFSLGSVRCGLDTVGEGWVRDRPQGQFCVIELTVTNVGTRAQRFADGAQKAFGPKGQLYEADTGAGVAANGNGDAIWNVVNPGNTLTVKVVFDIPPSASIARIELHDSPLSHGVTVDLPVAGGS
jgi:hypothetical protein